MSESNPPLISILTPSYNQGKYIEQTITSVLEQNYPRFEHIVIDGGSTDETVSVLKRYPHLKWVSERDQGQADSLNKGLRMATGDLVGWVNSDDYYAKGVFHRVREIFEDGSVKWAIGDVVNYYEVSGVELYMSSQTVTYQSLINDPDILRQQGAFFRTELLKEAGGWDPALYMVMDLDLWLRLAQIDSPRMVHQPTAYFRMHAEQKTTLVRNMLQSREIDDVLRRHGASTANRLRQLAKKRYWRLKSVIKVGLRNAGLFEAGPL
jgi:cellulose synthase/poly-beta-1,6-N-acetylglucosamine synthase-like glycosyltransferase